MVLTLDIYVGFLNNKIDMVLIDNYLRNVVGVSS